MSNATKCDRCGYYTRDAKRLHINGVAYVYDLCRDCVRAFDAWMECQPVTGATERVTKTPEMAHDTREKLEADVYRAADNMDAMCNGERFLNTHMIIRWLDRQAAITERETMEHYRAELERRTKREAKLEAERDESAQRIQVLEREIATLKEHRAANMEKLRGLTDECAELRKYRDEWKGLAEKYRADSIAAQEESERYRAKLGNVLDALHEAERAAR